MLKANFASPQRMRELREGRSGVLPVFRSADSRTKSL
jgi:hypothetical protein